MMTRIVGAVGLAAFCLLCAGAIIAAATSSPASTSPQSTTDPTNVEIVGLDTLTLASAVDSTGAQAAVDADHIAIARCVAVYSGADNANDTDLEGTIDGSNWHVIDSANRAAAAVFLLDDTNGPWQQLRANVVALGRGVTVTLTCKATVRQ